MKRTRRRGGSAQGRRKTRSQEGTFTTRSSSGMRGVPSSGSTGSSSASSSSGDSSGGPLRGWPLSAAPVRRAGRLAILDMVFSLWHCLLKNAGRREALMMRVAGGWARQAKRLFHCQCRPTRRGFRNPLLSYIQPAGRRTHRRRGAAYSQPGHLPFTDTFTGSACRYFVEFF